MGSLIHNKAMLLYTIKHQHYNATKKNLGTLRIMFEIYTVLPTIRWETKPQKKNTTSCSSLICLVFFLNTINITEIIPVFMVFLVVIKITLHCF